jgi:hypothetical protein
VTFAIYKEQEGGAALWLETQNVELDEAGRYTVLLGATKSAGLPLELFLGGETRWLGAQVQMPGEVEQGRVLLVSVPYALKAADAETLGGKPASVYLTTEQVGVGGTTVKGKASASTGTGLISPALSGTGSTNVVAKWLDSVGTLGNSQITDDGTNVNTTENLGALAYKFTGNAAAPTDATATILNQANVGPVFSGLSFKVRTGVPVPGDTLTVDANHNVSITGNGNIGGNASALAYKFTGNAAAPTDATATIFNQANVGPTFSGFSFSVQTGAPLPGTALTVDQNHNLRISGGGALIFSDGTTQTTKPITAVNTAGGSGLQGGATSGVANLSLLSTCLSGQLLKWNGSTWTCADDLTSSGTFSGGPTTFTGSTLNQIVYANQTGAGISNPTFTNPPPAAVFGDATNPTGFTVGVIGRSQSSPGAGVVGIATGILLTGNRATGVLAAATATSGKQVGVDAQVNSTDGASNDVIAGRFTNSGSTTGLVIEGDGPGGTGCSNPPCTKSVFTVDASGNTQISGNLSIAGTLSKSSGSFKIDDPLDPANKYLYHSFVESPDMMNVYNGVVTLDSHGQAWVTLPQYFEALNRDFRYQLTCIGGFAPVYVAEEVVQNRFKIAGGRKSLRVSWQVTGIRHDAFADAHPIPVEEEKSPEEVGKYMHPDLFGQAESKHAGGVSAPQNGESAAKRGN